MTKNIITPRRLLNHDIDDFYISISLFTGHTLPFSGPLCSPQLASRSPDPPLSDTSLSAKTKLTTTITLN